MRFTEDTALSMLVIGAFLLMGLAVASEVFTNGYNRFLFQKSYGKSIECRISYKGSSTNYIDQVCGPLPKFQEFVK